MAYVDLKLHAEALNELTMNVGWHAARAGSALAGGGAPEGLPVAAAQVALIVRRGRGD